MYEKIFRSPLQNNHIIVGTTKYLWWREPSVDEMKYFSFSILRFERVWFQNLCFCPNTSIAVDLMKIFTVLNYVAFDIIKSSLRVCYGFRHVLSHGYGSQQYHVQGFRFLVGSLDPNMYLLPWKYRVFVICELFSW